MLLDTTAPSPDTVGQLRLDAVSTTFRDGVRSVEERTTTFEADMGAEFSVINIHPEIQYQEIKGFGGAITESSGYTFSRMSQERQEQILDAYFGPSGNNYSVVRTHLDSSDFSLST